MKLLIKKARITDSQSSHKGLVKDILIENGKITKIEDNLSDAEAKVFEAKNLHISQGWIDLSANLCDPGFEHKEDLVSGLDAAAHGGFTTVVTSPLTLPITDTKSGVEYKINRSRYHVVSVAPMGTITEKAEGKNLAELYDMYSNGAVAFSDGKVQTDTGVITKALLYTQQFEGLVISHPTNKALTNHGQVNESINSSLTGLKGMPAVGEIIQLQRDLSLLEYTGGKMHFNCLSTSQSVKLIADAKKKGLKVTCDIAAHQLAFDDSVVNTFDTNYKVFPPFRTADDVAALLQGLVDGTVDAVCSDHTPEDVENKNLEFDLANFGIIGLQTSYAVTNTQLKKHLTTDQIIEKFAEGPRKILGLANNTIEVGSEANLTFFDPDFKWIFEEKMIQSKSKNTPFVGQEFTGRALAVYNKAIFKIVS